MNLLLDTCTFLWLTVNDPQLSVAARQAIIDPANTPFLSIISVWEICVKHMLGRLPLPQPPDQFVTGMRAGHRLTPLGLADADIFHLTQLPTLHKDPFDRMLICQATVTGMPIVTPDALICQYAVSTIW